VLAPAGALATTAVAQGAFLDALVAAAPATPAEVLR
jgi:hypothetical protein